MRYIPNLIPKQFRVLPERFKGSTTKLPPQQTSTGRILSYVGFGIVAFFALGSIMHPWLFIVLGIFAFLLLPYGSRRIEQFLHFRFTRRIKRIAVCFFIGISLPLFYHYGQVDFKEQEIVRIAEEAKKAQELADEQMENQRKEAFRVAFASLNKAQSESDYIAADSLLGVLNNIAKTDNEKRQVTNKEGIILNTKADDFLKRNRFADALPIYSRLLQNTPDDVNSLCNHALCLSKTGKIREAVNDLKRAMAMGDERASKLHDKINPIKRRVIGYETLCCDGSTSSARGRGACSWHGGVCDWNHPIYEEYRKYE